MTQVQAALKADIQHVWQTDTSLREAEYSPAESVNRSQSAAYAGWLNDASGYLRAGWRWLERKRAQQLSSRRLRIAETVSLGEKRSVSIVQVDGSQFLIGCSASSVQLLAVLDRQEGAVDHAADSKRAS